MSVISRFPPPNDGPLTARRGKSSAPKEKRKRAPSKSRERRTSRMAALELSNRHHTSPKQASRPSKPHVRPRRRSCLLPPLERRSIRRRPTQRPKTESKTTSSNSTIIILQSTRSPSPPELCSLCSSSTRPSPAQARAATFGSHPAILGLVVE